MICKRYKLQIYVQMVTSVVHYANKLWLLRYYSASKGPVNHGVGAELETPLPLPSPKKLAEFSRELVCICFRGLRCGETVVWLCTIFN